MKLPAMTPQNCARLAAVLFAAEAIFPIAHRLTGSHYRGFTNGHDYVIDTGLAVIWIGAAIAGAAHRSGFGLLLMLTGASVSLIHGFNYSVATSSVGPYGVGLPFLVAGFAQLYLTAMAMPAFRLEQEARGKEFGLWMPWNRHAHAAH